MYLWYGKGHDCASKFLNIEIPIYAYNSTWHYSDVIMSPMASQMTSVSIICLTVYSGADEWKHQSSASLAFVRGIHRWPVDSPHKGPVKREMFPFDYVIMDQMEIANMSIQLISRAAQQVVIVVTLFPTKYMKTHICITHFQLPIPEMFTCTVSVAARKSRGLSSWQPLKVSKRYQSSKNRACTRNGPATGTVRLLSRSKNHFL